MNLHINIHELVNEITQPNAVCVVNNEVPENVEERFLHTLYGLLKTVKSCILKEMYHPYIHIKDIHGTFLFNDRLHICEEGVNNMAMNNPGYCDIHLVQKKHSSDVYYCATISDLLADDHKFYMNKINFVNAGDLNSVAYKEAGKSIMNMVKKGEGIDKNTPLDTSVTVHDYDPNSKLWTVVFFTRSVYGWKF